MLGLRPPRLTQVKVVKRANRIDLSSLTPPVKLAEDQLFEMDALKLGLLLSLRQAGSLVEQGLKMAVATLAQVIGALPPEQDSEREELAQMLIRIKQLERAWRAKGQRPRAKRAAKVAGDKQAGQARD